MDERGILRLGDAPDMVELSLKGLIDMEIIAGYEKIDGGFRLLLQPDAPNYIDMVFPEARGFCLGTEMVHRRFALAFQAFPELQEVIRKLED